MLVLCVSDTVDERVYTLESKVRLSGVDLVLAAGDLPGTYLEFLVDLLDVPLYYVYGNHGEEWVRADGQNARPPLGCLCLDGRAARHRARPAGPQLLLAGLGGSRRYRPGPHQYTEAEMSLRALRLVPALLLNRLRTGRYLDLLLTHAPPWGMQDGPDRPHRGFRTFLWLIDCFKPRYLVHGHYDAYDRRIPVRTRRGVTEVVNAYGYHLLEVVDAHEPR